MIKKNLMVTIPNTGNVRIEMIPFLLANVGYIHTFDCPSKRPIYFNRNQYMETFLKTGCDWLLMIDSDTIPPIDALDKIEAFLNDFEEDKIKVISGWYNTYNILINKIHPVFFWQDAEGLYKNYSDEEQAQIEKEKFHIIDGCGGGFMLVHKDVVVKLKKPYFKNNYDNDITQLTLSEDLYFCNKIQQEAKAKIYLLPNIKCAHIKSLNI